MKIFLGWSGERSKSIAEKVRVLLETLIPTSTVFYSPSDIEKGTRWERAVARELQESQVGIWCLTRRSLKSHWIPFEAGAISKASESARVVPLLFGISPAELPSPLSSFQGTPFDKETVWRMVRDLHRLCGCDPLPDFDRMRRQYDVLWELLEKDVASVLKAASVDDSPLERVQGCWWERIQPDDSTAISYVKICADAQSEVPYLSGTSYGRDGGKVADWNSRGAYLGPHPEGLLMFYYWEGSHQRKHRGTQWVGSGEIRFLGSSGRLDKGRGFFTDTVRLEHPEACIKDFELRRATPDEEKRMDDDSTRASQIKAKLGEQW